MNIIKLSAIPSTNTFLKELSANENLPEFTMVVAENQQEGIQALKTVKEKET